MLTESVLLAVAGGVAGVALAAAVCRLLARLVPTALPIAEARHSTCACSAAAMLATLVSAIGVRHHPRAAHRAAR